MDHTTAIVRLADVWRAQGRDGDVGVLEGYLHRRKPINEPSEHCRLGAAMDHDSLASFVDEVWSARPG